MSAFRSPFDPTGSAVAPDRSPRRPGLLFVRLGRWQQALGSDQSVVEVAAGHPAMRRFGGVPGVAPRLLGAPGVQVF